jgi:O-antigen ligase
MTSVPRPLTLARASLLLLVVSLPLMKIGVAALGYWATLSDGLFLVTVALWIFAFVRRETRPRWHFLFVILALYFVALALSVLASSNLRESLTKLATQIYLLVLPVLVYGLVDTADDLRRLLLAWLAALAVPALIGATTVVIFYAGVDRALIGGALHEFGLLPPGHYPRLETTFFFPAMLCNYLTVGIFILAAAHQRRWLRPALSVPLLAMTIVTAVFTETPGLAGFFLALGACVYVVRGGRSRPFAVVSVAGAVALSVAISTVTPILHPTAPYLIQLPWGQQVAPAVRLLTWTGAWTIFLTHPVTGAGIGTAGLSVPFVDPSGVLHQLTDAHSIYLNIAAECGLLGLGALLLLIYYVAARTRMSRVGPPAALSLLLGLAWLDSFAVEGFTGSYEDTRHLWVLLGLWLASLRLETMENGGVKGAQGNAAKSGSTNPRRASTENSRSRE